MKTLSQVLWKCMSVISMVALLMPSPASASPKIMSPDMVREKIVKRGVSNWVCVEEKSGLALVGRITSVDRESFGLQLHNYPEITTVAYADVIGLRFGLSGKAMGLIIGAGVGSAIVFGVVAHHEFEANKPQLPSLPTNPALP
jgi:hypothetical protein